MLGCSSIPPAASPQGYKGPCLQDDLSGAFQLGKPGCRGEVSVQQRDAASTGGDVQPGTARNGT